MTRNIFLKIIPVLLVILISIPVVIPFFNNGYFPTHDGEWAVVRLADMFRTLKDLQFPPRFSGALNFGYGYPLFNFAYPFPYYFGLLLYIPLHSFVVSIKSIFVLSVIFSGIGMYLASYQLWKSRMGAFASALIYIYLPYRMVDLYVRGSIGESISFALFGFIFYFVIRLFDAPYHRVTVFMISILIGVLILTHNIMAVLFLPTILAFVVGRSVIEKRWDVLQSFFLSLFLGIGVAAFFWFPALFEKSNILLTKIPIADRNLYFVNLPQLIFPSWGYGTPTEQNPFTYQLGIPHILSILLATIIVFWHIITKRFVQTQATISSLLIIIIYLVLFLMLFSFTKPIWEIAPLLKEINYPWTILSQLGFLSSLVLGYLFIKGKVVRYMLMVICIISSLFVLQYAKPERYVDRGDAFYLTNEATTTSSSELMPLWVKEHPRGRFNDKVEVTQGDVAISNVFYNSKTISFNYISKGVSNIRVNTIYYPGWEAYANGEKVTIHYDNPKGVMDIKLPDGNSSARLIFSETIPRMVSNMVSIISLLVLFFILLRKLLLFK